MKRVAWRSGSLLVLRQWQSVSSQVKIVNLCSIGLFSEGADYLWEVLETVRHQSKGGGTRDQTARVSAMPVLRRRLAQSAVPRRLGALLPVHSLHGRL